MSIFLAQQVAAGVNEPTKKYRQHILARCFFLEKGLKLKTSAKSRFSESKSNCKSLPLSFFSWIVGNYDRGGIHKKSRREQKRENEASGRNILKGLEQKKEEEPELNLVPCLFRLD